MFICNTWSTNKVSADFEQITSSFDLFIENLTLSSKSMSSLRNDSTLFTWNGINQFL